MDILKLKLKNEGGKYIVDMVNGDIDCAVLTSLKNHKVAAEIYQTYTKKYDITAGCHAVAGYVDAFKSTKEFKVYVNQKHQPINGDFNLERVVIEGKEAWLPQW